MGAAESSLQKPSLDFDNLNHYEVLGVSTEASDDEIKVTHDYDCRVFFASFLGSWLASIPSTRVGNPS